MGRPDESVKPGQAAAPSSRPVVHVVDDDPSFLRAVVRRLEAAGYEVEAFGSAEAFLARRSDVPGCAVVDLRLEGQSGLDLQDALAGMADPLPVIFLTGHGDVHSSVRAMKHGAVDFLTKPVSGEELVEAVRRAIALDAGARAERRIQRELRTRYERLTPREREVFALVVRGMLNKQIAGELGTTERTVKAHRARVMAKMGVQSIADLARTAERLAGGRRHRGSSRRLPRVRDHRRRAGGESRVMEPRIEYGKRFPEVRTAMWALEHHVHRSGLDPKLLELVKLRASLINGCAYCVDMHTKVARSLGETEQRLYAVSLWRETPFYTERERAALAWTEAVTLVSVDHVPDEVYDTARQQFDEKELVDLTTAIVAINGWNRLAIAFRTVPGTFQVGTPAAGDREVYSTDAARAKDGNG